MMGNAIPEVWPRTLLLTRVWLSNQIVFMGRANFHESFELLQSGRDTTTPSRQNHNIYHTKWFNNILRALHLTSDNFGKPDILTPIAPYLVVLLICTVTHQCSPQSQSLCNIMLWVKGTLSIYPILLQLIWEAMGNIPD